MRSLTTDVWVLNIHAQMHFNHLFETRLEHQLH
jgi:hypothetical protein